MLAIEEDDLENWAKEVATQKADIVKELKQKQKESKSKSSGWFGFGGSSEDKAKEQAKESNNTLINQ